MRGHFRRLWSTHAARRGLLRPPRAIHVAFAVPCHLPRDRRRGPGQPSCYLTQRIACEKTPREFLSLGTRESPRRTCSRPRRQPPAAGHEPLNRLGRATDRCRSSGKGLALRYPTLNLQVLATPAILDSLGASWVRSVHS